MPLAVALAFGGPARLRHLPSRPFKAKSTRRGRALLAGEAVACVEREPAVAEGVAQGLADVAAGRLVSHEQAMAELDAALGTTGREAGGGVAGPSA